MCRLRSDYLLGNVLRGLALNAVFQVFVTLSDTGSATFNHGDRLLTPYLVFRRWQILIPRSRIPSIFSIDFLLLKDFRRKVHCQSRLSGYFKFLELTKKPSTKHIAFILLQNVSKLSDDISLKQNSFVYRCLKFSFRFNARGWPSYWFS